MRVGIFNKSMKVIAITAVAVFWAVSASALIIDFNLTSNNSGMTPGEQQVFEGAFSLHISPGPVFEFNLFNHGIGDAYISAVYFGITPHYEETLLFAGYGVSSPGVWYQPPATPPNPGEGIDWDASFSMDPENPPQDSTNYGVNAGEHLSMYFENLQFLSENELAGLFADGSLAVAMHVQSVGEDNEYSEWLSTGRPVPVPEPATLALLGTGLAAIGIRRRKKA